MDTLFASAPQMFRCRLWRTALVAWTVACVVWCQPATARAHDGWSEPECEDEDDSDGEAYLLLGFLASIAATSPWWGPPVVIKDDFDIEAHFPRYPYFNDEGGYLRLDEYPDVMTHPWASQVLVDYGTDFDDINRIGTRWHVDTSRRWGFDGEWAYYDESVAEDDSDHFSFGDVNFIWRFAQSEHAMWWTGIGTHFLDRDTGTDWGYQMTYGADIFVGKPWVLSGSLDWGRTVDDDFFHGRITFGPQWRHGEVFLGFETLNAGGTEADTMLFGFRIWY